MIREWCPFTVELYWHHKAAVSSLYPGGMRGGVCTFLCLPILTIMGRTTAVGALCKPEPLCSRSCDQFMPEYYEVVLSGLVVYSQAWRDSDALCHLRFDDNGAEGVARGDEDALQGCLRCRVSSFIFLHPVLLAKKNRFHTKKAIKNKHWSARAGTSRRSAPSGECTAQQPSTRN